MCERGENGRVEKGYNASQGGAAGMILYNPTASDVETDNHFLPTIHLEGPNTDLLTFLGAHPGITATWAAGVAAPAQGDVMAGFSSRGPIGEFLKPDITAPGVQILAGLTPESTDLATGPQGELYQAIAGTSMSSPHAAGVSALVIAAHPNWTPGQVKSALMTSSLQAVTNVDGSKAGVFDRGAGSIRANRALSPTLTISETAADFVASAGDPLSRHDLNIPSIYIDPLPGAAVVKRTVTNVTSSTQTFTVKSTMAGGTKAIVSPAHFSLQPGKSRTVTVDPERRRRGRRLARGSADLHVVAQQRDAGGRAGRRERRRGADQSRAVVHPGRDPARIDDDLHGHRIELAACRRAGDDRRRGVSAAEGHRGGCARHEEAVRREVDRHADGGQAADGRRGRCRAGR